MTGRGVQLHEAVPPRYRANVGICLVNANGLVFAGRRRDRDVPAWQMPQGGIDAGEDVRAAALRELAEETGVGPARVEPLDETTHWITYEVPADVARALWGDRYIGQAQKWVALRFLGRDEDVDVAQAEAEFGAWRWMRAAELEALIVPFKRPIYNYVFERFGPFLDA